MIYINCLIIIIINKLAIAQGSAILKLREQIRRTTMIMLATLLMFIVFGFMGLLMVGRVVGMINDARYNAKLENIREELGYNKKGDKSC